MLNRLGTGHLLVGSAFLLSIGLVMVYSASALRAELLYGSSAAYLGRQAAGMALGVAAALLISRVPLEWIQRSGMFVWLGTVVLLAATFTPLGMEENGARRWLALGPLSFQPLEPAKIGVIVALAQWLSVHEGRMRDFRVAILVPTLLAAVPAAMLMLQPDFGGALMILMFAATLVFAAGARIGHLLAAGAVALPALGLLGLVRGYRLSRIEAFLDPWGDPLGHGYQLIQSLLAFGTGGLSGTGLGSGQQKLGYLPEAHTDFILSVVGEELGLIGVVAVLACFALVGLASLSIASRARNMHAMLLAAGAGLLIWMQGLVNAGVAMGVLPTKGTTLPLVSYGRSSLICSLVAIGLILNTARPRKRGRSGWR